MIDRVLSFIKVENLISEGDHVAVALSGGGDSVALMHLLLALREQMAITVEAIHIHHGLRSASDQEASIVEGMCQRLAVPLVTERVDLSLELYQGMSTEEAARTARYKVFEAYLENKGGKIALGHHMDDQAETVLLNLFRGAGAQGLKGMMPQRDSYIRPLLCVDKDWVTKYCAVNQLEFVRDESNEEVTFTRNFLRHEVMPLIESTIQPKLAQHISRTAKLLREENAYLGELALAALKQVAHVSEDKVVLHNSDLKKLPLVLQRRVIRLALEMPLGYLQDLTYDHVEQILDLIHQNKTGKTIHLPGKWQLRTDYELSHIEKLASEIGEVSRDRSIDLSELNKNKSLEVEGYRLVLLGSVNIADYPENAYTKWFDYDKIRTKLNLRTRRPGDWLRLGNEEHRKKLKNYLIDAKISRPERDKIMLLTQGDEVIWIVGHRINAYYKVNDTTNTVLEVSLIKEE